MDNAICDICGAAATIRVTEVGRQSASEVYRCEKHPPVHVVDELVHSIMNASRLGTSKSPASAQSAENIMKHADETIAKWRSRKEDR